MVTAPSAKSLTAAFRHIIAVFCRPNAAMGAGHSDRETI
jgi:hypothetical protein